MRFFRVTVMAVLVAALFAYPASIAASADRGSFNNWHVHDGFPGHEAAYTDESGLRHVGRAFFPTIFGSTYASDPTLWAYCTDATDKALVGGDGGAMINAGECRNDLNIIHLLGIATGAPAPTGWMVAATSGDFTIYYLLTPR